MLLAVLDEGAPRKMQIFQAFKGLTGRRAHRRLQESAHAGEHDRIDTIGLDAGRLLRAGACADGFSKAPRLPWLDLGEWQAGHPDRALEGAGIGASGLVDNALDPVAK